VAAVERVILWDVDGTLVRTGGVGAEAFATAIETLFGVAAVADLTDTHAILALLRE
jgi:phosphoglycolate phosphatase-like HAD superfamily hydrolase